MEVRSLNFPPKFHRNSMGAIYVEVQQFGKISQGSGCSLLLLATAVSTFSWDEGTGVNPTQPNP